VANDDLTNLAVALRNFSLVTASSGLGSTLPREWGFSPSAQSVLPRAIGPKVIVSGSCSAATRKQVSAFLNAGGAARELDPMQWSSDCSHQVEQILSWATSRWEENPDSPILIYSTSEPAAIRVAQETLGPAAGELVEKTLSSIAVGLVARGAGQLIVAG